MKRTLAILLATLLTLGMFAIGASAAPIAGDPDIYALTVLDAANKDADVATGTALQIGMILEPKLEEGDDFDGDDDVALDSDNLKVLWFFSTVDATGAAVGPDYTKAGKLMDSYTVVAADLGKVIGLKLVLDVNGNNVINDADTVYGDCEFEFGAVELPVYADILDDLIFNLEELVDLKVLNEETITVLGYSVTLYEALAPFTSLADEVDAVNKAIKAAAAADDKYTASGLFADAKAAAVAFDNLKKAADALKAAADDLADDVIDNALARLDAMAATLKNAKGLTAENQNVVFQMLATIDVVKHQIQQLLTRIFDEDTTAEDKFIAAGAVLELVDGLQTEFELVEQLLNQGSEDPAKIAELEKALKDAEKALKDAEAKIKELEGKVIVVEKEWYEFGIYGLLGVGGWASWLQTIVKYVFFGWIYTL